MRKLCLLALLVVVADSAQGQRGVIEVRRVRTMVDRTGKGFTRAPLSLVQLSGGRYAISEVNELPLVADSTGSLVKRFGRGSGPGEFAGYGSGFQARGDSLLATDQNRISVFDRNLRLVRTITIPSLSVMRFFPAGDGFVVASPKINPPSVYTGIHIVDKSGAVVRSFLTDTMLDPRSGPQPGYRVSPVGTDALWAASNRRHRLEKWSLSGRRLAVIDTQPSWFVIPPGFADGRSYLIGGSEANGVLWVMSNVPVSDYRERVRKATAGARGETDARAFPSEDLSTAWLEAYDPVTGKQLAELSLKAFGVALLSGSQYAIYTEGADGSPQLEIWEMKLKR